MVGVSPADAVRVKTFAELPLLSSVQLLLAVVSPKIRLPITRLVVSRWTVLSAVISSVLKSAIPSSPSATPPDQLPPLDHSPPLAESVQTPLVAADTECGGLNAADSANKATSVVSWRPRLRDEFCTAKFL